MMRGKWFLTVCLLAACISAPSMARSDTSSGLRHNPFDKPQVLAEPLIKPEPVVEQKKEPPPLKGTLVSADIPMAIVEDTLLRIGEEHAGFRLVSVEEGAAVFEHEGEEITVSISDTADKVRTR